MTSTPKQTPSLVPGLYDRLITEALASFLPHHETQIDALAAADAADYLAAFLHAAARQALRAIPGEDRLARQVAVANDVVRVLASACSDAVDPSISPVVDPARLLLGVAPARRPGLALDPFPPRPGIPLSQSDLLVNARDERRIGAELRRELASADRIDLLCSFIKWAGFRLLRDELQEWISSPGHRLRVLTTTYVGVTERRVLEELAQLGADVRVSYDTRRTRLHAKAWLFHRDSGFSTAFIGSSNLSASAMTEGLEWNVRLSQIDAPEILDKFRKTFDSYWEDPEFERFDPERFEAERQRERGAADAAGFVQVDLQPYSFQQAILDRLEAERTQRQRMRNLVVAATGTGKTVIAALDYRRLRARWLEEGATARLLFVAHRDEILKQSRDTFRLALRDRDFGELLGGGEEPQRGEHVFASIMTLKNRLAPGHPRALGRDDYDVVIIDEVHHAEADTYVRLLAHVRPRLLLGLTATPERADGKDIFHWFGEHIAAELRLWDALDRGLLCPFHYFAVHDEIDLRDVRWVRGRYDLGELDNLYTGDHHRVHVIRQQLQEKVPDVSRMRALGFCAGVGHARFMAEQFAAKGLPAAAVCADTPADERRAALRRLADGRLRAVFTVDLFNEGVDVPEVDTILFLRPTESATVFLQQLGRGLRRAERKDCVTVLDFVGHAHKKFRFDRKLHALVGGHGGGLKRQIEQGFPVLPAGCAMQLDRLAEQEVLRNLRDALSTSIEPVIEELRALGDVSLREALAALDWSIEDLYRRPHDARWTWSRLRRAAGLPVAPAGPYEEAYGKRLPGMLHVDDALRLDTWRALLDEPAPPRAAELAPRDRRLVAMLHFALWGVGQKQGNAALDTVFARIWEHGAIRAELLELLELLAERDNPLCRPFEERPDVPLMLGARYGRDEILAAFDDLDPARPVSLQAGVRFVAPLRSDLFLVTIQKSERDYSPRTLYRDGALSQTIFQWDSQNTTGPSTPTGRRYIAHEREGSHVLLFVRRAREDERGGTMPYTFLGPARYLSHEGAYPMAIRWELLHPIPAAVYPEVRLVA